MTCKPLTRRQQLAKFDALLKRSTRTKAEKFQEEARTDRRHARVLARQAKKNTARATLAAVAQHFAENRGEYERHGCTLPQLQRLALIHGADAVLPRKDRAITFDNRDIEAAKRRAAAGRQS
jgi:hypothetical protein